MANVFTGLRVGIDPYMRGQYANYERAAWASQSEENAAAADARRRTEMMRQGIANDPYFQTAPQTPSFNPSASMPDAAAVTPSAANQAAGAAAAAGVRTTRGRKNQTGSINLPVVDPRADINAANNPNPERPLRGTDLTPQQRGAYAHYLAVTREGNMRTFPHEVLNNNGRRRANVDPLKVQEALARLNATGIGIVNGRIVRGANNGTMNANDMAVDVSSMVDYSGIPERQQGAGLAAQGAQASMEVPNAEQLAAVVPHVIPGAVVSSTQRSPTHNQEVGGAQNSMHLTGEAMDIVLPPGTNPETVRAALQHLIGAPITEFIPEGDHLHVGWRPEGGANRVATMAAGGGEQMPALGMGGNPTGPGYDIGMLQQQRADMAHLYQIAMRTGNAQQALEIRGQMYAADMSITGAAAERAIQQFDISGNPNQLAGVLSQYTGNQVQFQRNPQGGANGVDQYTMFVDGQQRTQPMTAVEIGVRVRAMISADFAHQLQEIQGRRDQAVLESGLRRQEHSQQDYEQNTYGLMRDQVEWLARREIARLSGNRTRDERLDEVNGETVMTFTGPDGNRYMAPVTLEDQDSPSSGGRHNTVRGVRIGNPVPLGQ